MDFQHATVCYRHSAAGSPTRCHMRGMQHPTMNYNDISQTVIREVPRFRTMRDVQ
jgi:hypothetical protein